VIRHADAGYDEATSFAERAGVALPRRRARPGAGEP
jgi:hypothetical protein